MLHEVDDEGLTPLVHAASFVDLNRWPRSPSQRIARNVGAETFLPSHQRDVATQLVKLLLDFDLKHNNRQIDLVIALPVAAANGASLATAVALLDAKAEVCGVISWVDMRNLLTIAKSNSEMYVRALYSTCHITGR